MIELILSEGAMSRSEIAERMAVSPSVVTGISSLLIEQGILCECGYRSTATGKGRRNQLLDVDVSCGFAIGVGLYERSLSVGLCTIKGDTLSHRIIALPENLPGELVIEEGIKAGREILSDCCVPPGKLFGIGLCMTKSRLEELGFSDQGKITLPGIPETIPTYFEPADRIIAYSESAGLPVNPEGMYVFGCGRVVREFFREK